MLGHVFVKGTQYSLYAASILTIAPNTSTPDNTLAAWAVRCVLCLTMAAVAYLLNDTMKTIKETKKMVNKHAEKLAVHDIMYEQWLNELMTQEPPDHPQRRRADIVMKAVAEVAKQESEK